MIETKKYEQGRLVNGDSIEEVGNIAPGSVDLILADLPYGQTRNKWDRPLPMAPLWEEYRRVVKPNGAIVLTGQGMFSASLMFAAPKLYKYTLIWKKNKPRGHLNAKKQPLRAHEDVLVFYDRQPTYNPQMTVGHKPMNYARQSSGSSNYNEHNRVTTDSGATERYPTTVLDVPVVNNDDPERIHPTQKPVALGEWVVRTFTNPGDLVLDNCSGSGAFLIAAMRNDRMFLGIEGDPEAFLKSHNALLRHGAMEVAD